MNNKQNILDLKSGDFYEGIVKILRKAKPGPVIFNVTDGKGNIEAVIKDSNFEADDVVKISGIAAERLGKLRIEIEKISKSEMDFEKILDDLSNPVRTEFSIQSERYNLMKQRFLEIAKRIRKAIFSNQPIMIRHHNDSDGINSGLAIEHSCRELMEKVGINPEYNLYRSPSKAPFYEITDVFRDIIQSKRIESHDQPKPLILVLDNGSTPEDLFGFKSLKLLGYEAIVIDHHNPVILNNGKTAVCPYLSLHLNPYIFGLDSKTSAGMLCYELARMINENWDNKLMPAVAALSDRCDIPETDKYVTNSKKTIAELKDIGVAIDFAAYHLKFDSGKGLLEELYNTPEIVQMINSEVNKGVETQLQSTLPYLRTQDINGIIFSHIDLEKYTLRFTYPTPGKVLGLIHDQVALGKENSPVITMGYVSDMIIIRATKPILPVQKIIDMIKLDLPEANVDGGGHEMAGTIKFVPAHLTTILERIKQELRKINIADFME